MSFPRTSSPSPQSGTALLLSLVMVTIVAGLGMGFIQLASSSARSQVAGVDRMRAFYLAEAGLAESFLSVRMGRNGSIASQANPASYGDGLVWVESARTSDSRVWLRANARVGTGRATLGLIIDPADPPLGFFADEEVVIESTLMVDGFDSHEQTYVQEVKAVMAAAEPEPFPEGTFYAIDPGSEHYAGQQHADRFAGLLGPSVLSSVLESQIEQSLWPPLPDPGATEQWVLWHDPIYVAELLSAADYSEFLGSALAMKLAHDAGALVTQESAPSESSLFASESVETLMAIAAGAAADDPSRFSVHTEKGGVIGSNGNVSFLDTSAGISSVYGSVVPGLHGGVTGLPTTAVSGSTASRALEVSLDPVRVPALATSGDVVHDDVLPFVLASGSTRLGTLSVGDAGEVVVRGPATLVVHDLLLAGGSTLTLDTRDGDVELYVTGSVVMDPASFVATTALRSDEVSILAGKASAGALAPNLALEASSAFHGTIYAPESTVRIGSNFEVFGSVVGGRLEIAAGARLHFDDETYDSTLPVPRQDSWRILDLPVEPAPGSPEAMAVAASEHPALSAAHDLERSEISIRYTDTAGVEQTYAGPESMFDWEDVASVDSVQRQSTFPAIDASLTAGAASDPGPSAMSDAEAAESDAATQRWWETEAFQDAVQSFFASAAERWSQP